MIDLHAQTTAGGGRFPPERIVRAAVARRVRALAFADRHTVAAVAEGQALAERAGIAFFPCVEVCADHRGRRLSILAYFIRTGDPALPVLLARAGDEPPLSAFEVFDRVRELSGTPVLARGGALTDNDLEDLAVNGLAGIEVFSPVHDGDAVRRLLDLARRLDLLVTGGSGAWLEGAVPEETIGVQVDEEEALLARLLEARLPAPR